MAAELFGVGVLGRVMGIVLTADGVAEATAPMLVGYLRDRTGSYDTGFIAAGRRSALAGAVAIALLPTAERRKPTAEPAAPEPLHCLMRIVDAKVIVCSPGRNFVTLKLVTEDGVYGLGDATLNGRELAVASYLSDHVMPLLIGRDARRIEDIWQYLYKGAYWRRGPVTMAAIAAVDTALWDILRQDAQRAGVSAARRRVARGGDGLRPRQRSDARRDGAGGAASTCDDGLPRDPRAVRDSRRRRMPTASAAARCTTSRRRKGMPLESVWSTERYLDFVPPLFERLRREVGFDVHLLHDVHHRLTPIEAARLGKSLEPYRLFWLEDPVPAEDQAAFRTIRQHTTTPIAVGEVFNTIYDCAAADRRGADRLHPDDRRPRRRHQPPAQDRGARRAAPRPHRLARRDRSEPGVRWRRRCTSISASTTSASRSTCGTPPRPTRVSARLSRSRAAPCIPATRLASASTSTRALAATYPYEPAYLPVNRKLDGTVHSW